MKAIISLPTLLLLLCSWSLPKLNTPSETAGKIIKATPNSADFLSALSYPDTTGAPELVVTRRKGSYAVKTVVIDPGHGGHDPGCHGASSKEKHVCLAVGKYLSQAIQANFPDVKVIMTRSSDVFIPLNERAAIATRNKADLFISIHCNAILNANKTMGTETYVLGLHATEANLAVAKRENEAILLEEDYQKNYDGYDPNSPEAHIMFSMFQNAFLEQSLSFADKVQQHSYSEAKRKNRGVKQAGFIVLKYATMPSVLVETGFLTNATEESFLRTKKGQKTMANALLLAFRDYKQEMEGGAPYAVTKLEVEDGTDEPVESDAPMVLEVKNEEPAEEMTMVKPVKQDPENPPTNVKPEIKKQPAQKPELRAETKPEHKQPVETATHNKQKAETPSKILAIKPVSESTPSDQKPVSQNTDIQFRVQLAASPKHLDINQGKWTKVDYLIQVIEEKGLYKYQVVNFATESEAVAVKTKLRSLGFSDAFVVAYQNGERIK